MYIYIYMYIYTYIHVLTRNVAAPAVVLFRSISIASNKIPASGAPTNFAVSPWPTHHFTAFGSARLLQNEAWRLSQGCHVMPRQMSNFCRILFPSCFGFGFVVHCMCGWLFEVCWESPTIPHCFSLIIGLAELSSSLFRSKGLECLVWL